MELDSSESKRCVKVDAYQMLIYNTDVSYLLFSKMGHMAMLLLNLRIFSIKICLRG